MRRPFIAGNWKMNLGIKEAVSLAQEIGIGCTPFRSVDVALALTTLAVDAVNEALQGTGVHVASQNHHESDSGAFTGAVSATMLKEAGCAYAIIGHSERRTLFGETLDDVHNKVHSAFKAGLLPILCIGETLEQRENGQAQTIVQEQLLSALKDLSADQIAAITIAYEPVWAIGTGKTASPAEAQSMHAFIRSLLQERYPSFVANDIRIQYGGSVKPHNAKELLSQPDIDGALVGGASLTAKAFIGILTAITQG